MGHSQIDELYFKIFGKYPTKAGVALEQLSTIAYMEVYAEHAKVDQRLIGNYSGTEYQLDGLAEKNGQLEMIEAKDYSISGSKVGRGDIQKLAGALPDLDTINGGVFASATDYTLPAKDYANASANMPGCKPIKLYNVRNSSESDEEGRIKIIHVEFHIAEPDCIHGHYSPVFTADSIAKLNSDFPKGLQAYRLEAFKDKYGNIKTDIATLTAGLSNDVDLTNEQQTVLNGTWNLHGLFVTFPNGKQYELEKIDYEIPIHRVRTSFEVKADGTPCLLIQSLDGSTNKLLTDKQLKRYCIQPDGSITKKL
jgi:hypothetical protein